MKYSFIIPYYNGANHIESTLNSIRKQTVKRKIEIIIIDDCSKSKDYKFLRTLNDNDLIILRQTKNQGPGAARNRGITMSRGEYLIFVDSDDTVEPTLLELLEIQARKSPDVITFDYYLNNGGKKDKQQIYNSGISNFDEVNSNIKFIKIKGTPWGKAFKRSFIIEKGIIFSDEMRGEDIPFTKTALMLATKTLHIDKALYNYKMTANSIMKQPKYNSKESLVIAMDMIEASLLKFNKNSFYNAFAVVYLKEITYGALSSLLNSNNTKKEIIKLKENTDKKFPNWIDNEFFYLLPRYNKIILKLMRKECYSIIIILEKMKLFTQKLLGFR